MPIMEVVPAGVLILMVLKEVFSFVKSRNGNDPHSIMIANLDQKVEEGRADQKKMVEKINKIELTLARDLPRKRKR